MSGRRAVTFALALGATGLGLTGPASAQQKEVLIGMQCDRTGATQITGVVLCPAMHDYYDLINAAGGVDGYKIKADEIDNEYKVPQAVEAYQRHKQEGAVLMTLYGTPMTVALNQRLEEDKIATTSPGFGIAAAADGARYPYLFPIAATYWSQGAAAVQFVKDKLGGSLKGKKIAYIFYDNPAGREPLPIVEDLQKREGFELRTFAVPPPGCRGRRASARHRTTLSAGFRHRPSLRPVAGGRDQDLQGERVTALSKVVGLVWASSEADIDAAGGFGVAEGYHAMQFAGAGDDYPVRQQIKAMYKKDGKEPIKLMDENTVYYNRGLLQAAIHVEAIRNALKATGGKQPTGTDIKNGLEQVRDFTLGGLVPPLEITPADHEGGGWVQVFQVHGGKFVKETDWFRAYRDVVTNALKTAE